MQEVWDEVLKRDPDQPEFQQAVKEVMGTMAPVFERHPEYLPILQRLIEPERTIIFRVRHGHTHRSRVLQPGCLCAYTVRFTVLVSPQVEPAGCPSNACCAAGCALRAAMRPVSGAYPSDGAGPLGG